MLPVLLVVLLCKDTINIMYISSIGYLVLGDIYCRMQCGNCEIPSVTEKGFQKRS